MATFPNTVSAAATGNALPGNISLQNTAIDPTQIYVAVVTPFPGYAGPGANGAETYYRLSDLINYIVATAKGL